MSVKLELIKKATLAEYVEVNGLKYFVDGKKVMFEPTTEELNTAFWLSKKLNKEVIILPKIKQPENIKTADYMIDNEYWDLKGISSNKNYAVYSRIRNQEEQASNFIIDISKSKLTIRAVTNQINELYKLKNFKWLNKFIIKKNNTIEIIVRNKKSR